LFSVADSGAGIAQEDLGRLFEKFWQRRRSDRRGVGLGLAIARGIVSAHGGRIWAESQVGIGSTFHFTLPAVSQPNEGAATAIPGNANALVSAEPVQMSA
jgi:signal transduction histidine kinase